MWMAMLRSAKVRFRSLMACRPSSSPLTDRKPKPMASRPGLPITPRNTDFARMRSASSCAPRPRFTEDAAHPAALLANVLENNVEIAPGHVSIGTMHLAKGLEFRAVQRTLSEMSDQVETS